MYVKNKYVKYMQSFSILYIYEELIFAKNLQRNNLQINLQNFKFIYFYNLRNRREFFLYTPSTYKSWFGNFFDDRDWKIILDDVRGKCEKPSKKHVRSELKIFVTDRSRWISKGYFFTRGSPSSAQRLSI